MVAQRILLPYNFTTYDEKALDFVVRTFANQKDAKITLFYSYTPLPELDTEASPVLKQMKDTVRSLSKELSEKETGLESAKGSLLRSGFSVDQVDYIFKKRVKPIADEIIEIASKGQYTVLVLSRQPGKATRLFTRSVHNRVLAALKNVTICIAT
jgi:hypothetical protein